MSARYSQSKAETQRHADILKTMLKQPENKLCADCKRNDPRWASTNLGCFMCIRCSGIHRGMGVHITRIKSVDLDTWSPEQIANVQRWGNKRANAYWEAHLKPGHSPPEHKMESFIRSKYELKRWAMEGPVPEPESLDDGQTAAVSAPAPTSAPASSSRPSATATRTSSTRKTAPTTSIDLLAEPPSTNQATRPASAPRPMPAAAPTPASNNGGGLFDLDFSSSAPAAPAAQHQPKRDAKADILSLFASAPPPRPTQPVQQQQSQQSQMGGLASGLSGLNLGGGGGGSDLWGAPAQPQSSSGGFDAFDSFTSAAPRTQTSTAPPPAASSDVWGSNPWGSSTNSTTTSSTPAAAAAAPDPFGDFSYGGSAGGAKKQSSDAFSDIWA